MFTLVSASAGAGNANAAVNQNPVINGNQVNQPAAPYANNPWVCDYLHVSVAVCFCN